MHCSSPHPLVGTPQEALYFFHPGSRVGSQQLSLSQTSQPGRKGGGNGHGEADVQKQHRAERVSSVGDTPASCVRS